MSERLNAMGELAQLKRRAVPLKIEIEEGRKSIRELLMTGLDPEKIDGERIAVLSVKLAADVARYRELLAKVAGLKKDYGL